MVIRLEHLFAKTTEEPSRIEQLEAEKLEAEQLEAKKLSDYLQNKTMIIHSRLKENFTFAARREFNQAYKDMQDYSHKYRSVEDNIIVNFLLVGIYVMVYSYRRNVESKRDYKGIDEPYWNEISKLISAVREIDRDSEEKIAIPLIYAAVRRIALRTNDDAVVAISNDDVTYQVIDFVQDLPDFIENDRGYKFLELYKLSRDQILPITLGNSPFGNVEVSRDDATYHRYNAFTKKRFGITREGDIKSLRYAIHAYLDFLDEIGGEDQSWSEILESRAKDKKTINDDAPEVVMLISGSLVQITRLLVSIVAINNEYELDDRENEFINNLSDLDRGKIIGLLMLTSSFGSVLEKVLADNSYKTIHKNRHMIMHRIRADLM